MCMSAICWAWIDRVYFGTRLEDTSKIGFDDAFQYIDFRLPWEQRKAPFSVFLISSETSLCRPVRPG